MLKVVLISLSIILLGAYFLNNIGILSMHEKAPQVDNKPPMDVEVFMKEVKESEYYKNLNH